MKRQNSWLPELDQFGDLEDIEHVNRDAQIIRMSLNFDDREEINPQIKDVTVQE